MVECPSLLITDDDRSVRETLGSLFQQKGFRTWLAADGEEAIRIVKSETIHVAVLDMHMPRLTGLDTLRQVRQYRNGLPCILMSGGLDATILADAQKASVFSVLSKPVPCSLMTRTVRKALQQAYGWAPRPSHDD